MAAQEASEDFDLAGVNVSDADDEDFDWASLDEPEQTATSHARGSYTLKAGAIPFAGATTPATQQQIGLLAPEPSTVFATERAAHGSAGTTSELSPQIQASTVVPALSKAPALPTAVGASKTPAIPGGVPSNQTVSGTAAAAAGASPATPSSQERPRSAGVAAGPPAPRYAAGPAKTAPPAVAVATAQSSTPGLATSTQAQLAADPASSSLVSSNEPVAQTRLQQLVQQHGAPTVAPFDNTAAAALPAANKLLDRSMAEPAESSNMQEPAVAAASSTESITTGSAQSSTSSSSSSTTTMMQQHAGVSGGWGWGFGGLSSKLQQVAIGAAKDLQELTASVQQAVAEVVAADDVSDVDKLSAYQAHPSRPPAPPAVSTAAPPAALAVSRDSQSQLPTIHEPPGEEEVGSPSAYDAEEQHRLDVLNKLQGRDTQLEAGLKVIDEQVDLLAASAAKALGSLWGGFSNVAKTGWTVSQAITTKVEAAAKEVAKELVVGLEEGAQVVAPVTTLAERLAAQAEKGLESVGRVGASLLEPQFNSRNLSDHHHQHTPSDWAATFDSCFELYGGSQAAEELEQLSSECAGICNRARAKLQQVHREQIDATLSKLVPAFDLAKQQEQAHTTVGDGDSTSIAEPQQPVEASETVQEGLDHMYLPVAALCSKGKHKMQQLHEEAEASAADAAAQDADTAEGDWQAGQVEITTAAAPGEAQQDQEEAGQVQAGSGCSSKVEALLSQLLSGLRSTAVKSLAEVSAGQLMVLLALGRSVAAVPRYGKPLDDGLEWPAEAEVVAAIMRQQVQRMLDDIQQLAGGFKATAPQLLSLLQSACSRAASAGGGGGGYLSSEAAHHQASLVVEEVAVDCNTAVRHITDGFGKLLYVVLLSSLHRASASIRNKEIADTVL